MKTISSSLPGALLLLAAAASLAGCGAVREESDAGTNGDKDGGLPPVDSGIPPVDGGLGNDGGGTDGGSVTIETTVPQMNNLAAVGHPADGSKVHFKAITVSPRWRVTKKDNATNPNDNYCLYGVFVADADATVADYNGVLVVSESTVDASTKNCNTDSQLTQDLESPSSFGTEIEVTGFYDEFCSYYNSTSRTCNDKVTGGGDVLYPEIRAHAPGAIVKTGRNLELPTSLPAVVTIDAVNSVGTAAPYSLGSEWWKWRAVLVRIQAVHPLMNGSAVVNPDGSSDFCEWQLAPQGAATPLMRVDDASMFGGTNCPHRPTSDVQFTSIVGHVYWAFGNSKLLPRSTADASPALP